MECKVKGCHKEVINGLNYCQNCLCSNKYCSNPKIGKYKYKNSDIVHYDTCIEHAINRCDIFECNKLIKYKSININDDNNGGYGCDKHRCKYDSCPNIRHFYFGFFATEMYCDYCLKHLCHFEGCFNKVVNDDTKYCQKHTCQIKDCYNKKKKYYSSLYGLCNSNYCFNHKCHSYGNNCANEVMYDDKTGNPLNYCSKHGCRVHNMHHVENENHCNMCIYELRNEKVPIKVA